jgi:hypothetical protein
MAKSFHAMSALFCVVFWITTTVRADSLTGSISGGVQDQQHLAVPGATITARNLEDSSVQTTISGADGSYRFPAAKPGAYEVAAQMKGFSDFKLSPLQVDGGQTSRAEIVLAAVAVAPAEAKAPAGFVKRLFNAYRDDWKGSADGGPEPKFRGYPAPETVPPYPFTIWPYGGSVTIGQPFTQSGPLMNAIWGGSEGGAWKDSGIQVYGWLNAGANLSTSKGGGYSNYPAAYAERGNTVQLDQEVLYIERQPDTVQTDHIDWGFRLSPIYGLDYRFTTSKGILSNQLLGKNQENGFDVPMAYFDLYIPQVAQGMNIRIGRYISLPDIEAQLAPNNYTYSHSLTYTFDCYTQTGINVTTKLSDHWLLQLGLSPGCDVAPWDTKDAKLTANGCLGYTWRTGADNLYACDNSLNDGKYAYNNLQAFYLTWYHKFNSKWHTDTESWYQYERKTPNLNNPIGQTLVETNAGGAFCAQPYEVTCYAPEWAVLNYVERQVGQHDYISIRNEFFNDLVGQRTGFKTRYTGHLLGWGHWIGTTILLRPELNFERSYDAPAFDNGTKKNQFMVASDVIFFF